MTENPAAEVLAYLALAHAFDDLIAARLQLRRVAGAEHLDDLRRRLESLQDEAAELLAELREVIA